MSNLGKGILLNVLLIGGMLSSDNTLKVYFGVTAALIAKEYFDSLFSKNKENK